MTPELRGQLRAHRRSGTEVVVTSNFGGVIPTTTRGRVVCIADNGYLVLTSRSARRVAIPLADVVSVEAVADEQRSTQ